MPQIPIRQAAVGSASALIGGNITTAKVSNAIAGDKELEVVFTNGSSTTDATNVFMFPGCWRTDSEVAAPATNVTFSSPGFASWASFLEYYKKVSTNVYGIRIETTDTENFQSSLLFLEKDPTGREEPVKKSLSKFRVPVGTGFSETIELSENDINFVVWPGLEVLFSKLKKNTSVSIYFKIRGWNKVQELNALKGEIIG